MIQFKTVSVSLDTQRNITGFAISEALGILFPIVETIHVFFFIRILYFSAQPGNILSILLF